MPQGDYAVGDSAAVITAVAVCTVLLAIGTLALVAWYADGSVSWHVGLTCFLSWFVAFSIIVLVPLDILSSETQQTCTHGQPCEGSALVALVTLCWNIAYWLSFILAWFVLTIQHSYTYGGGFTVYTRLKAAVRSEAKFYILAIGAFGAYTLVRLFRDGFTSTKHFLQGFPSFCHAASHGFALLVLVLLLGYGLVELPRTLWRGSIYASRLHALYSRAVAVAGAAHDAETELHTLCGKVSALHRAVQHGRRKRLRAESSASATSSASGGGGGGSGSPSWELRCEQVEQLVAEVTAYDPAALVIAAAVDLELQAGNTPRTAIAHLPQSQELEALRAQLAGAIAR
jgi:hypothetical protein